MPELVALVQSLVDGHTDEGEERELLALLEGASPEELNDVLTSGVARPLMTSVDNRVFGPDLRSELIDLLARRRRADLSIEAQAALIHAMQEGRTTAEMERAILDLFLALRGDELTALKNQVNQRTDHHDLEGLVFVDIDDDDVRTRLVEHFQSQAGAATVREAKVLSDIDDTAFSRIHETRYPKGTLIPGVLALYEALDQGPDDAPRSTGDLTFVTARPMDALGLIENHTRDSLRKAGIGTSSVLSGGFLSLHAKDAMAGKKLQNIEHYNAIYPEYDLVFIGDSGQGDVLVGERMYEAHGRVVKAVFIHDVVATPPEERARHTEGGIHFVDTYVGAGVIARRLGLISAAGLERIVAESRSGFDQVPWDSPEQEAAMRELLERDIALAEG